MKTLYQRLKKIETILKPKTRERICVHFLRKPDNLPCDQCPAIPQINRNLEIMVCPFTDIFFEDEPIPKIVKKWREANEIEPK